MSRPTPIFVYGTARSGTTALTNLILSHDNVAGFAHPLHWGAHEIPLHDYARHWGNLRRPEDLEWFLADLEGSDLWRLADEDTAWWRAHPPADMYEWFLTLMDRAAMRAGCACWVVKLDPKVVNRRRQWRRLRTLVRERYGDEYHVIGVHRQRADVIASYLRMPGPAHRVRQGSMAGTAALLLGLARYRLHQRDLERLAHRENATVLEFDEVIGDAEALSRRLGAEVADLGRRKESSFPRNTSFRTTGSARSARPDGPGWQLVYGLFDRLPVLATVLVRLWEWRRPPSNPLYYRLRRAENAPDELAAEFRRTGHEALIPHIFDSREA